jgi:hypothetical protein
MCCGGCEMPSYCRCLLRGCSVTMFSPDSASLALPPCHCSKECQRADWPRHKRECRSHQAHMATVRVRIARLVLHDGLCAAPGDAIPDPPAQHLQAQGRADREETYQEWLAHRSTHFFTLACKLLENKLNTHVMVVQLDYQPSLAQPFQVGGVLSCSQCALVPLACILGCQISLSWPGALSQGTMSTTPGACREVRLGLGSAASWLKGEPLPSCGLSAVFLSRRLPEQLFRSRSWGPAGA